MILLNECLPKFFVIFGNKIERRRQSKIMAIVGEQLHAEAMNRAEEGAIERGLDCWRALFFENPLSCSLLHLIRCAMSESHDHKLRQDFDSVSALCQLNDALANRVGFARAR